MFRASEANLKLPQAIVDRFAGKSIAITGYEHDQVMEPVGKLAAHMYSPTSRWASPADDVLVLACEQLEAATSGRVAATMHRVAPPAQARATHEAAVRSARGDTRGARWWPKFTARQKSS